MERKLTGHCGLSKARLGRMHDVMAGHIEAGEMPGTVTLVSRGGETHVDAIGDIAICLGPPSARPLSVRQFRWPASPAPAQLTLRSTR